MRSQKVYLKTLQVPLKLSKFKVFHHFSVVLCQIFITSFQKSFLTLKDEEKLCGKEISKYWNREYWFCEIPLLVLCQGLLPSAGSGLELQSIQCRAFSPGPEILNSGCLVGFISLQQVWACSLDPISALISSAALTELWQEASAHSKSFPSIISVAETCGLWQEIASWALPNNYWLFFFFFFP